jgi:hypothetical protein
MKQKVADDGEVKMGGGNGRIALIAQIVWVAIVLLTTAVFVKGMVVWFPALQQLCTATAMECQQRSQLTSTAAQSLHDLGYPLVAYAWYTLSTRLLQKVLGVGIGHCGPICPLTPPHPNRD